MKKISIEEINDIDLHEKVISFSTDTIYGVGALIDDEIGIDKIYNLKQRDYSKPLAVLVSDVDNLINIIADISLIEKVKKFDGALFWYFLGMYGSWRFFVDFLRYYEPSEYVVLNLTFNQIISLLILIFSVWRIWYGRKVVSSRT